MDRSGSVVSGCHFASCLRGANTGQGRRACHGRSSQEGQESLASKCLLARNTRDEHEGRPDRPNRLATPIQGGNREVLSTGQTLARPPHLGGLTLPASHFFYLTRVTPNIATKIMWNNTFRPRWSDDVYARYFGCHMVYEEKNARFFERDFTLVGHYVIHNLVGRTEVEPLPIDSDFKLSNRLSLMALQPVVGTPGITRCRPDSVSLPGCEPRRRRLDVATGVAPCSATQRDHDEPRGKEPVLSG